MEVVRTCRTPLSFVSRRVRTQWSSSLALFLWTHGKNTPDASDLSLGFQLQNWEEINFYLFVLGICFAAQMG
jgi:hypothetical protein